MSMKNRSAGLDVCDVIELSFRLARKEGVDLDSDLVYGPMRAIKCNETLAEKVWQGTPSTLAELAEWAARIGAAKKG